MDILTHAGMGIIMAAPFAVTNPELALGLVFGSVAPDLDTFSRVFGKRAFLAWHQTYSHALPLILFFAILMSPLVTGWFSRDICLGFAVGAVGHSLLDYSNTLGVTLLAPFSRHRFKLDWVFFIDLPVILATAITAVIVLRIAVSTSALDFRAPSIAYGIFVIVYWAIKGRLHSLAASLAPAHTVSLIPSAAIPWIFLGFVRAEDEGCTFRLNLRTGKGERLATVSILDDEYASTLESLPEFRAMRSLSPCYHVAERKSSEAETELLCRDLRIRNFNTTFGDLRVWLSPSGKLNRYQFHV